MEPINDPVAPGRVNDTPSRAGDALGRDNYYTAVGSDRFTATPQDAVDAFSGAGLPIKLRTAQRYCEKGKLVAIRIDPETGEQTDSLTHYSWAIDPSSYEAQWARMREKREREERAHGQRQGHVTDATPHVETRHDASSEVVVKEEAVVEPSPKHDTGASLEKLSQLEQEVDSLRKENFKLERDKQVAEYIRDGLQKEVDEHRERFDRVLEEFRKVEHLRGIAEGQLTALGAPIKHPKDPETENEGEGAQEAA